MNKTKVKYSCKICGKKITYKTALYGTFLCQSCAGKIKWSKILKITKKKYYCLDCDKEISRYANRCSSCAGKNRKVNITTIKKISNSLIKHLVSEETKMKQQKSAIKRFQDPKERKKLSKAHKGKILSKQHKEKISLALGGTGIPYEKLKLVFAIRCFSEYKKWRFEVFKRDNYTCQECKKNGCYLEAHHKKSFAEILSEFLKIYDQFSPIEDKETLIRLAMKYKDFWNIDNGQTLCEDCHKLTDNYGTKKENEYV